MPYASEAEPRRSRRLARRWPAWLCALAAAAMLVPAAVATEDALPGAGPLPVPPASEVAPVPGDGAERAALHRALRERRQAVAEIRDLLADLERDLSRLTTEYESLRQRLTTAGLDLSGEFASLLRRRLDRLESDRYDAELLTSIQRRIEAARIEQFRVEELAAALREQPADPGRAELIQALGKAVDEHIAILDKYFQACRSMRAQIADYRGMLRERLFWLPSAAPAGPATMAALFQSWGWLAEPAKWRAVAVRGPASMADQAGQLALMGLLLAALLGSRRWCKRRLAAAGEAVDRIGRERFLDTAAAVAWTALLALPWPVLLAMLATIAGDTGDFGAALAAGLGYAALVVLPLALLFHVVRRDGLAARHFHWNERLRRALRVGIPPLLLVLIPATVVIALTEAAVGDAWRDSLGRAGFSLASLALAWFIHRLMRAAVDRGARSAVPTWLRALHMGAVAAPLMLMVLALYGYYYTAIRLETILFLSAVWLAGVLLLQQLAVRALTIRQRRLSLARQAEHADRANAAASPAPVAATGEGGAVAIEDPGPDLKSVSEQTAALLRLVVGLLAAGGLLMLWADVLPALNIFETITLWQSAPGADGAAPIAVTLQDLLLALAIGALTVVAARNLPGLLEVALLSRLRLGPGGSYAATTLATYVIVILGTIVALGMIGAEWSKLKWLVAALGVGLGFGLQEIVANFVSGLIILFERPVRVGDTVTVGGNTGTVSRIRIRATTIVDWDRKEQIVPNKTFVTQDLTNWTLSDAITRVIIRVGVAYNSDLERVDRVLRDVVAGNKDIASDPPPTVFCVNFGDSSIDFEVRIFVRRTLDIMPLAHAMRMDITRAFREQGIEIPFPQRDIHVRSTVGPGAPPATGD